MYVFSYSKGSLKNDMTPHAKAQHATTRHETICSPAATQPSATVVSATKLRLSSATNELPQQVFRIPRFFHVENPLGNVLIPMFAQRAQAHFESRALLERTGPSFDDAWSRIFPADGCVPAAVFVSCSSPPSGLPVFVSCFFLLWCFAFNWVCCKTMCGIRE